MPALDAVVETLVRRRRRLLVGVKPRDSAQEPGAIGGRNAQPFEIALCEALNGGIIDPALRQAGRVFRHANRLQEICDRGHDALRSQPWAHTMGRKRISLQRRSPAESARLRGSQGFDTLQTVPAQCARSHSARAPRDSRQEEISTAESAGCACAFLPALLEKLSMA